MMVRARISTVASHCVAVLLFAAGPAAVAQEFGRQSQFPARNEGLNASTAGSDVEPPSAPVRQATPKDPRKWAPLIHQTYPREAALKLLEGSVKIRVVIDTQGRVADCFVRQSSGHLILDQAACNAMRSFAVFNPAIDASGLPTVGSYSTVITYKIRETPPQRPIPKNATGAKETIT